MIADPVADGSTAAFRTAFATIAARIDRLALAADRPGPTDHAHEEEAARRLA